MRLLTAHGASDRIGAVAVPALRMYWVVVIAAALLWLGLASYPLLDNNEGLYASIAKEMLSRSGWITPHLNGVAYEEKPPLFYYVLSILFSLFGTHEWSARAASASAASACLAFVYWFAKSMIGRAEAQIAVLILSSSVGFVMLGRTVMPDMLLMLLFCAALLGSFIAWKRTDAKAYCASLAALAGAVLTKGLLPLALFLLVWTLFVAATWRSTGHGAMRFLMRPVPWLMFLAVALPWHVAAAMHDPSFVWRYFVNEHVLRFFGSRIPADTYSGLPLYHLPRVVLLFFPWIALVPTAIGRRSRPAVAQLDLFLWLAVFAVVGFFTLANAKANYYVALALPFASLWLVVRMYAFVADGPPRSTLVAITVLTIALVVTTVAFLFRKNGWYALLLRANWQALSFATALIIGTGVVAVAIVVRRLNPWLAPPLAAAVLLAFALAAMSAIERRVSTKALFDRTVEKCSRCTLMLFRDYENMSAVGFYSNQSVVPVIDSESSDLWWGQIRTPDAPAFVTSMEVSRRAWAGEPIAIVVSRFSRKAFLASPLAGQCKLLGRRGSASSYLLSRSTMQEPLKEAPMP